MAPSTTGLGLGLENLGVTYKLLVSGILAKCFPSLDSQSVSLESEWGYIKMIPKVLSSSKY